MCGGLNGASPRVKQSRMINPKGRFAIISVKFVVIVFSGSVDLVMAIAAAGAELVAAKGGKGTLYNIIYS